MTSEPCWPFQYEREIQRQEMIRKAEEERRHEQELLQQQQQQQQMTMQQQQSRKSEELSRPKIRETPLASRRRFLVSCFALLLGPNLY